MGLQNESPGKHSDLDYLDSLDSIDDAYEDDDFGSLDDPFDAYEDEELTFTFQGREEIPGAYSVETPWWDELIP